MDRDLFKEGQLLRMIHKELRPKSSEDVDDRLAKQLTDKQAAELLYSPLREYVAFASQFGCEVGPTRLIWQQDLPLNDGSILRLVGLNSALVSDDLDDDGANKLILGRMQVELLRTPGVEYVTLCHHPPSWLIDGDAVDSSLLARARVHLFGHKHVQRANQIDNSLRLVAGAMHPERREKDWLPRYNFLRFRVAVESGKRVLKVGVIPRVWDKSTERFDAQLKDGLEEHAYALVLDPWTAPSTVAPPSTPVPVPSTAGAPPPLPDAASTNPRDPHMDHNRRLTYRFLRLPYHLRIEVGQALGLIHDEDKGVADAELFRRFFARARDEKKLEALWGAVEEKHANLDAADNPFKGR